MFHFRLMELEAELLAKQESERGQTDLSAECLSLVEYVEHQVEVKLADPVPEMWRGWVSYRRNRTTLIISRGRAFWPGGLFGHWLAGLDVSYGLDIIHEYQRHFDISPPQDLDHLMLNFGPGPNGRVFLWYGENLAAYRLIFASEVADEPHRELSEAVVEACTWILSRPKDQTLAAFLEGKAGRS